MLQLIPQKVLLLEMVNKTVNTVRKWLSHYYTVRQIVTLASCLKQRQGAWSFKVLHVGVYRHKTVSPHQHAELRRHQNDANGQSILNAWISMRRIQMLHAGHLGQVCLLSFRVRKPNGQLDEASVQAFGV